MVSNRKTVMKRTYNRLDKMPMEGAGAKEQDRSRDGAGQDSVVNSSAPPHPLGTCNEYDRVQKRPDSTGGDEVESRKFCLFLDKLPCFYLSASMA